MENLFGKFAEYYDLLYKEKDYQQEASFIDKLIKGNTNLDKNEIKILDLACGTGKHAFELSQKGYSVEGSDISNEMIKIAKEKYRSTSAKIPFYNESFQTSNRINKKYNVIIAMFSAMNYLKSYKDFSLTLKNVKKLLHENGFFIFDCWNGNSVLKNYLPVKVKKVIANDLELIRITNTSINEISQLATLKFDFMLIKNKVVVHEFSETHILRYYFAQEMMDLILANNFDIIHRCPFMNENDSISTDDWNLSYIVKPM